MVMRRGFIVWPFSKYGTLYRNASVAISRRPRWMRSEARLNEAMKASQAPALDLPCSGSAMPSFSLSFFSEKIGAEPSGA